jgi:hypothetical protein
MLMSKPALPNVVPELDLRLLLIRDANPRFPSSLGWPFGTAGSEGWPQSMMGGLHSNVTATRFVAASAFTWRQLSPQRTIRVGRFASS